MPVPQPQRTQVTESSGWVKSVKQLPIILINDQAARLASGYLKVCETEAKLQAAWGRLLTARRNQHRQAYDAYSKRAGTRKTAIGAGFLVALG